MKRALAEKYYSRIPTIPNMPFWERLFIMRCNERNSDSVGVKGTSMKLESWKNQPLRDLYFLGSMEPHPLDIPEPPRTIN